MDMLRGSEEPIGGWVSRGYHRKAPSTTLFARGHCEGTSAFVSRVLIRPWTQIDSTPVRA